MDTSAAGRKVAEHIRALKDFTYQAMGVPYGHMGATITDAVLQAGLNYEHAVWPRVQMLLEQYPDACTTSSFLGLLRRVPADQLLNFHGAKIARLVGVAEFFAAQGLETEDKLRAWLCGGDDRCRANVAKLAALRGIGPKTIDYFKILCGEQDSVAVDVHLLRFLEQAGVPASDYEQAHEIVVRTAEALGVSAALLDHSIWAYMSKAKE